MKSKNNTFKLSDYFKENILYRTSVNQFFEDIELGYNKRNIIDFSKIKFISRSAADQLIREKSQLTQQNYILKYKNISKPLIKVLIKVKNSKKSKKYIPELQKVSSLKDLKF